MKLGKNSIYFIVSSVIILSFVFFFYTHGIIEKDIKESLILQQKDEVEKSTKSVARGVSLDLEMLSDQMEFLANSKQIQEDLLSQDSYQLIDQTFKKIDSRIPTVALFVMDTHFTLIEVRHDEFSVTGFKLSEKQAFMDQIQKSQKPIISTGYRALDGSYQITITYPVIDKNTGQLNGIVGVAVPTAELFKHHGNIFDVNSQHMIVYDKDRILVAGPLEQFLGMSFSDSNLQKYYNHNQIRNEHSEKVFSGNSNVVIYNAGYGEEIDIGYPVIVNGVNEYFVFIITPTKPIYAQTSKILESQQTQMLVIMFSIVITSILFLAKHSHDIRKEADAKIVFDRQMHDMKIKNERLSAMGTLAARLAHDLRNPLGVIKNTVAVMQLKKDFDEETKNYFKRIERSISRMSHQVESVLDFIRVKPLEVTNVSLWTVLSKICENYSSFHHVKINLPAQDVTINCDQKQIEIVFENLIRNAIEAMNGHGTINVTWDSIDHGIAIKVEDDGPNIPPEHMSKIFDPLFTTKQTGTGLGLVSCKNIIEQHDGTLSVTNNPVTFIITLPKKILQQTVRIPNHR